VINNNNFVESYKFLLLSLYLRKVDCCIEQCAMSVFAMGPSFPSSIPSSKVAFWNSSTNYNLEALHGCFNDKMGARYKISVLCSSECFRLI